ncbi:MAG: RagB/SusD family nutrient uptake outer membrane protein [Chloroflexi bacterium]|nr:MAG: RagB/SusD family nutrient uptake outer membrane protein [Chloroflexota bacterium]
MTMKKWNRLLYGIAGALVAAGVAYACNNFLDQPTQGVVDQTSLETKAGVEGSLIAAYRSLDCSSSSAGSWGCAASNWVWGSIPSGDAHKGSNAGDQQPINDIEIYAWNVGEAEGYLNQKWSQVYEGVYRANATIRLLNLVVAAKPTEISVADQNGIRGEALFLRAHYHFEAYRMWGHIPYYTEADSTPVSEGGYRKANDLPLAQIINNIIADLNQAITLLPATPRNGDKGRLTKWAAMAYKGRVQVYGAALTAALWDSAVATFRAVRQANVYDLETSFDHVWTGFQAYKDGKETILAFQASVRDGEPSGWNSNWGERLNFPHSGSHFGCCGFHQPSQQLVNFFAVDAVGLPVALSNTSWNTTAALSDTNFSGGQLAAVDPRLDWTVGRDKVPYKDWTLHNRSWIRDATYSGPYSPKKNVHEQAANAENNVGWQATQTNDVNIHLFRFADLLLLNAEAHVHATTGVLDSARVLINLVRARAGKVAQGCGAPTDSLVKAVWPTCATNAAIQPMALPMVAVTPTLDTLATPWAVYKIGLYTTPFTTIAQADLAVRYERRLELAMEGQRFFDLRRWGGADSTITNYISVERSRIPYLAQAANIFTLPKYALYPIPQDQIELSRVGGQDRLVQNTGW